MWKGHAYESHLALRITGCHNIVGGTGSHAGVRSLGSAGCVMTLPTTGQSIEKESNAGLVTMNLLAKWGQILLAGIVAMESAVRNETFRCLLHLTGGLFNLASVKVCTKLTKLWSWLPLSPPPGSLKCRHTQARNSRIK